MTNEKMRADFEAHIAEMIVSEAGLDIALKRDGAGDYETSWVQNGWQFWQAANLKANQWRPVDETVPKTADELLTLNCAGHRTIRTGNYLHHMMRCAVVDKEDCFYIGWLPLPPTGTEDNV